MANGGWGVVIVIILLAIFAGVSGMAYVENMQHEEISQAALKEIGERLANADATATAKANEMQTLHQQLATATVIVSDLKKAQEDIDLKATEIANQKATIEAIPGRIPPSGGYPTAIATAVSPVQATPKAQMSKPQVNTMGFNITWLPALALGFFVMVVAGAYRMLKIEDGQQGPAR